MTADTDVGSLAARAIELLGRKELSVGTAESITGGLIAATLTSVPGASAVFLGGIVAYGAGVKVALLGVPAILIDRVGTVDPDVAAAMARGARERLGSDVAIAVTGVAGPDPADGRAVGTVHVALDFNGEVRELPLSLAGSRGQIRHDTVKHALRLLLSRLTEDNL